MVSKFIILHFKCIQMYNTVCVYRKCVHRKAKQEEINHCRKFAAFLIKFNKNFYFFSLFPYFCESASCCCEIMNFKLSQTFIVIFYYFHFFFVTYNNNRRYIRCVISTKPVYMCHMPQIMIVFLPKKIVFRLEIDVVLLVDKINTVLKSTLDTLFIILISMFRCFDFSAVLSTEWTWIYWIVFISFQAM